MNQGVLQPRSP